MWLWNTLRGLAVVTTVQHEQKKARALHGAGRRSRQDTASGYTGTPDHIRENKTQKHHAVAANTSPFHPSPVTLRPSRSADVIAPRQPNTKGQAAVVAAVGFRIGTAAGEH